MTYQLIHGDCLDVLPTLTGIDAVVTDPPYGINICNRSDGGSVCSVKSGNRFFGRHAWDVVRPERNIFDMMLSVSKTVVIWGGNYFTDYLPPSSQWLIWDKGQRDFSLADCEMAWCSLPKAARVFTFSRAAALSENGLHPTQKPIAVMRWCIRTTTKPGDTILDPFMGSGSTGVAAVLEGRNFVGVEIDPTYYAIAQRRIADAAAQPRLLDVEPLPQAKQSALLEGI